MDPEIQREFEEQLRQMSQMLSDINSTMAGTVKSMQTQTSAISGNTTSVKNQTQANNQLSESVSGRTKAEEAASIANEKFSKTTDSLATGFKAVGSSLTSFGSAIRDASAGYSKYSSGITQLTKGVGELAGNFGFLGKALGVAITAVGSIAAPILEYNDALLKGFDDLSKFGAGAGLSAEQIMELGHEANFSSKTLGILTNNAKEMNRGLIAMSGSFTAGVETFSKFIGLTDDQLKQYRNLGFSQEELAESMTKYAAMQAKVGNSMVQTPQQLQKASLAYIDNLVTLAELTGIDVAKMQDAQNQALADENFNAYIFKKQLERDRTTDEAEKAKIQAIIDAKLEYAGTAKATLSATEAAARIQAISTDGMVNFTESNSVLLLQNADIQAQQDKLMKGESQALALQEDNYRIQTNLSDQYGDMIAGLGQAGKDIGSTLGAFNESRESANLFKQHEKELAGLSGEALQARMQEIKDEAAGRVEKTKGKTTGATADDATKQALERQLNIMTDQFLDPLAAGARKLINEGLEKAVDAFTTMNNFLNDDLMPTLKKLKEFFDQLPAAVKIASGALLALAGMGGLGLLKSAITGTAGMLTRTFGGALTAAANGLKSLLGIGGGKAPTQGPDGRYRDARGRFASAPSGGGKLANLAKGGTRILGKLALPLTAGMAAYDAYQGFNADPKASFGGKMANAGKSALSGMTFGLSDYITGGVTTSEQAVLQQEKAKEATEKQVEAASKNETTAEKSRASTELTSNLNKKTVNTFGKLVASFGKLVSSFGKLIGSFGKLVGVFGRAVTKFETAIKDLNDKLSTIIGPTTTGTNANTPATVDNVMAMNYQKESAGGTQLRVKGMGNAETIGGGYGLRDASRQSAFDSMTPEQKAKFTQETGFTKAPTLNQLVNKEGTGFLSDKAQLADNILSRQFTENTIQNLSKRLGRQPTMSDVRGAHWLGDAGYARFMSDLATNPNMTMAEFYDKNKNFGGKRPSMKQFGDGKMTLQQFQDKLIEQAGGAGGGSLKELVTKGAIKLGGGITGNMKNLENLDPSLENALASAVNEYNQKTGKAITLTSGYRFPGDQSRISSGSNPKASPGMSRHERGLAVDINSSDVTAMNGLGLFDKHGLVGGQASSRNGGYVNDPPHIELKAAKGGIFDGPTSGYPVELHGGEMVAPLTMDSILMKLAKTPALSAEGELFEKAMTGGLGASAGNDNTDAILRMHSELINVLSSKLDNMIEVLDEGNDTRDKIFKHSMV